MSKIILSAREILYLSALAGASELMGIPDGFYGMDDLEIKQEILKLQTELEKKGWVQTDFNGNFEVDSGIMQAINTCAFCAKYISVETVGAKSAGVKALFYYLDDKTVKIEETDSRYELTPVKPADVGKSIFDRINWADHSEERIGDNIIVTQSILSQVKDSAENDFTEDAGVEELRKAGCTGSQARIIYSGLNGTSNYISVVIVDFNSEENDVLSIMAINSKAGSLALIPVEADEREAVEFRSINYDAFKSMLTEALALIGITENSGDFV